MIRLSEMNAVRITPYAVAIMAPILALFAAVLFAPIVRTTLLFFIITVLFSAWYGGFRPGILSGLISALLLNFFLLEPAFELLPRAADVPLLIVFAIVVVIISIIEESRLRTEKALRQSRDQLEIVLQGINDGVTAQDPNGEMIFANEAAARFAGFKSSAEMVAAPIAEIRSHYELLDKDGKALDPATHPIRRVFKEGVGSQLDFRWRLVDEGINRWMNFKASPVFDQDGRVQMSINIMKDITDDKEAGVILQNAHERLQTMLTSINNGVVATDIEGRVELMNPMAEKLTGWTQAQALGKPFESVVSILSKHNGSLINNPIQIVLKDAQPIDMSMPSLLVGRHQAQVPIDYNVAPIKEQDGSLVGAVMVFRDISDRLKAEQERNQLVLLLANQQKRLENILANVPGIVWESVIVPDSNTQKMEFVNSYAEKMLGYPQEDWLKIPDFGQTIIHPEDVETSQREAREIYERGDLSASIQFRCIAKDGRVVPIEAHYSILTDEAGNALGTTGLMTDISQRKADENALRQSALDLKRSNEQLEQFAYVASHDLQEPLRMITSYLQLLERRYKNSLDQDAFDFIAYAVDGATRMKALINDLLAYSRVKTGEQNFAQFESKKALDQAITNLQMQIKETGAEITYDEMPSIVGNEGQFVQLFQNLLSNSLKFHGQEPPKIKINAEQRDKVWKFSIKDNGIGIEPQYVDRIFIIFQRLHTKDRYPGTGIGLAICKKVVEHHGGRIWAESTPGDGTTFQFTIPSASWRKSL